MLTYRYQDFWDAVDGGVLTGGEPDDLKTAAENGTVAVLLADWAQNHADEDFRAVCEATLGLL
jgi:hypothetical protein